jgi:hypothetical protein
MSGPKISATEMKRLHLFEEERRRLLQSLVRLKEELKRRKREISNLSLMLIPFYSSAEAKEIGKELGKIEQAVEESLPRIEAALTDGTNIHMAEVLQQLLAKHDADEEILLMKEEEIYNLREQMLGGKSSAAPDSHVPEISIETAKGECKRILALVDELIDRATECNLDYTGLSEIRAEIEDLENDEGRDGFSLFTAVHHIDVMRLRPLRERIEKEEKRLDWLDEALSNELAKYHMLCQATDTEPKKFPFAEESIDAIRYECGRIISARGANGDVRLLMKKVRESLEELGYAYLGEREENLDFYRELYRLNEETVLHVIYDSTGKITMEVAAFDTKDRPPHQREVDRLVKEQEKFCTEYEKIFHLINAHGLAMKKEAMYPPSPDFAQVINTSEFDCSKAHTKKISDDIYMDRRTKYLYMTQ